MPFCSKNFVISIKWFKKNWRRWIIINTLFCHCQYDMILTLSDIRVLKEGSVLMIKWNSLRLPTDNKILQQDHCLRYNVTYIIFGLKASNSMCIQTHFSGNPHHVKTITSSALGLSLTFVLKTPYIIFNN
jgi:hypothetical protein